jgi:DNA-binding GntR family transcriptional regulator
LRDENYHPAPVDATFPRLYNCGRLASLCDSMRTLPPLPEDRRLAARAYATMRERILRGEFALGQVISRRKVAAELGVSFLPASEALLRLECDGLLETRARAGTRLRMPTRQDVLGHFVVREALEVQAAMMFAARSTAEEKAGVIKLAARLDARTAKPEADPLVWRNLHEELHLRVAACARCGALSEAVIRISALASAWAGAMRASTPANPVGHHTKLIKVLTTKGPAKAGEAMRSHIQADRAVAMLSLEPWFELQKQYKHTFSRTIGKETEPVGNAALALRI